MTTPFKFSKSKQKKNPVQYVLLFIVFCLASFLIGGSALAAGVKVENIDIDPDFVHLEYRGSATTLSATIVGRVPPGATVTWSVSDSQVLSIVPDRNDVHIRALVPSGSAIVTATYEDVTATAEIIIGTFIRSDTVSILLNGGAGSMFSATIDVEVFDIGEGPQPPINWTLSDEKDVVTLIPDYTSATVIALGNVGSVMVTAEYKGLVLQFPIIVADLQANTKILSPELVESVEFEFDGGLIPDITATLDKTNFTLGIQPGDILVNSNSTAETALQAKVTGVTVTADQVIIEAVPASLADTYNSLDIDLSYDQNISVNLSGEQLLSPESGFECDFTGAFISGNITFSSIRVDISITTYYQLDAGDGWPPELRLGRYTDIDASWDGLSVGYQANAGGGSIECEVDLAPPLPIAPLDPTGMAYISLTPVAGFELTLMGEEFGRETITIGGMEIQSSDYREINYSAAQGFGDVSEIYEPWSVHADFIPEIEEWEETRNEAFTLGLEGYVGADFGIGFAGVAAIDIIGVQGGLGGNILIPVMGHSPYPWDSPYVNPYWEVSNRGEYSVEVLQEALEILQFVIDPSIVGELEITLLEIDEVLAETPDIQLAAPGTVQSDVPIDLTVSIWPFGDSYTYVYEGRTVEFWASYDFGEKFLIPGGTSTIDGMGQATITWTPNQDGFYQVVALVYDRITGLPYPDIDPINLPFSSPAKVIGVGDPTPGYTFWAYPEITFGPDYETTFYWNLGGYPGECHLYPGDGTWHEFDNCATTTSQEHSYFESGYYTAHLVFPGSGGGGGGGASLTTYVLAGTPVQIPLDLEIVPDPGDPYTVYFTLGVMTPESGYEGLPIDCVLYPDDAPIHHPEVFFIVRNCHEVTPSITYTYDVAGRHHIKLQAGPISTMGTNIDIP